ncbi:MAG: hypothetical protein LWW81_03565 [Rhodocyclales bacterium]|nr:hypothetical protein [Rhodocyclales bacterium]
MFSQHWGFFASGDDVSEKHKAATMADFALVMPADPQQFHPEFSGNALQHGLPTVRAFCSFGKLAFHDSSS